MALDASFDHVLQRIADRARSIGGGAWAAVGLFEPGVGAVRVARWLASPQDVSTSLAPVPSEPGLERAISSGHAYQSRRVGGSFAAEHPLVAGTRVSIALPVRVDGRVEGVLCVGRPSPRSFSARSLSMLPWLAEHAGSIAARTRVDAESRRHRQTAEVLALMAHATSQSLDAVVVGRQIVHTLLLVLDCARASLFERDPAGARFRLLAVARAPGFQASVDVTAPDLGPVETVALRDRRLVVTADFFADPDIPSPGDPGAGAPVRSMLATPLLHDDTPIGILSIGAEAGRVFEPDEIQLFRAAADHAAVALQNARLHAQVTEAARVRERVRIADTLHDTLSQLAFSVGLKLDWCLHQGGTPPAIQSKLEDIRRDTGSMMGQIRQIIGHLSAADEAGATVAGRLSAMVSDFRELTGCEVRFVVAGDLERLPPAGRDAVQKALQEALVNITKHARARRASVRIEVGPDEAVMEVADDGIGVPPEAIAGTPGHLGLRQMRERMEAIGGRLEIEGRRGVGTSVRATFPLVSEGASIG